MSAYPRRRILAVKLADFGDALLSTPALAELRRQFPAAKIDVLAAPAAAMVYRHTSLVDEIIVMEKHAFDRPIGLLRAPGTLVHWARRLRARHYDAVVLFHRLTTRYGALKHAALCLATGASARAGLAWPGARRAWFLTHRAPDLGFDRMHEVEAGLAAAAALGSASHAAASGSRRLIFDPGAAGEAGAARLLAPLDAGGARRRIALHPGGGGFSLARRWPAAYFAALADALTAAGADIILVGTSADDTAAVRAACRQPVALDLTGRTDLAALAAVLRQVDLLVANDGGVMHLATAMNTPVVALFGPSNPAAWGPWWPGPAGRSPHRALALPGLPCRPCFYVGHALGAPQGCPTRDCLQWLSPARVLAEVQESLDQLGKPLHGTRR